MKTTATIGKKTRPLNPVPVRAAPNRGKVHPVLIYPFKQPAQYSDLEALYQMVARLGRDSSRYARPLTVMDRKTHYSKKEDREFIGFRESTVARYSEIVDAWCVDT